MNSQYIQHGLKLLAFMLFCVSASGCSWSSTFNEESTITESHLTVIPAPKGTYGGLAWIDNWLVLTLDPSTDPSFFSTRLWRLHPDGSNAEQLHLLDLPECDRQGVSAPTRLPNNKLGYIVRCGLRNTFINKLYLMAYDMHTEQSIPLVSYELPSQQVGTGGYSWNASVTRGITSDGNGRGLYEQLYWLNSNRPESLDVGLPQAFAATWAPNGSQIAFLGAPEQGLTGIGRADVVFNLYLMQPDGAQIHSLVRGLHYVASMAWSPDSRWIVLPASLSAERREKGLWLVDAATGNYRRIARGDFAAPAWSPDGQRLALLQFSGEYPNQKIEIVIAEVGSLLHSP